MNRDELVIFCEQITNAPTENTRM